MPHGSKTGLVGCIDFFAPPFNLVSSFVQWFRIVAFQTAPANERDRPGFDPRMGSIILLPVWPTVASCCWQLVTVPKMTKDHFFFAFRELGAMAYYYLLSNLLHFQVG